MESPVSAFEMYKSQGFAGPVLTNGKRKNKKKKSQTPKNGNTIIFTNKSPKKYNQKKGTKKDKLLHKNERPLYINKSTRISAKSQEEPPVKRSKSEYIESEHEKNPKLNKSQTMDFISSVIPLTDESTSDDSDASIDFVSTQTDSAEEGLKALEWLIAPYKADEFLNKVWEKNPLHIARKKPSYYKDMISTPIIDNMLRNENIMYTKNIDITSYVDGKRETHNPVGRAHPHTVWDYYLNGCSVRLLNPQTYIPRLHLLNATLQEFFNSFVGANAYLTPPDSQGFAPHYDDIEALIMQVEGKKHWRVYRPRLEAEALPRVSSANFDQDEIGEPILEVTLSAGDMLYFPRGFIHQGVTVDGEHSLHVTVSFYQKHSWADLLEKLLPEALKAAIAENVELRRGLPFDIYDNFGLVNSDVKTPRKEEIAELVQSLVDKVKDYLPIDAAVDEMAKRFQHTALPPVLTDMERAVTVYGDNDVMVANGKVTKRVEMEMDTRIRLLRKNILRVVNEDEGIRIYFYTENSLEYEGLEPQFLEIDEKLAPAVETLIVTYPEYVSVENLNVDSDSDKIQIASDLWENGLVMTEYPLETIDD